ncbi:MAG: DAK2 domain-containing protein [Coriobacteriales bacterium]|jgi:DAK2 domain fusion protein YloV|nr:DAK2 domain-containing protein [Coriobacteriales bacterium]
MADPLISAQDVHYYFSQAANALKEQIETVNNLNVFPVPDGDTGTNMSLTFDTVVKELGELPLQVPLSAVQKAITHGSLMGARGNSGVITSQILRGICDGLVGAQRFDAAACAQAAASAVQVAFNAVRKPVEGTILTVLKDCSQAASAAAEQELNLDQALQLISEAAMESVRRTPELLPVLKENGVVDAGGYGLAVLLEGFAAAVSARERVTLSLPDVAAAIQGQVAPPCAPQVAIEQVDDWEGSAFRYCTEFLLNARDLNEADTLDFLGSLGDCELLVGASPDYKVHVHTNNPGHVLTYMTDRGQVSEVHINNMQAQSARHQENLARSAATAPGAGTVAVAVAVAAPPAALGARTTAASRGAERTGATIPQPKPLGFIAVCAGIGTARILESQGVDFIVNGGQTMNPSTRDFVDAINAVDAEAIIIFPNNKNVIMAANAAATSVEKPVAVVPTTSVPQSFSALFVANAQAGLQANVEAMQDAIALVRAGEVTTAIKDARAADGTVIHTGDVIGIADDTIEVVGQSVEDVALELVGLITQDADVLTILAGQDLSDTEFKRVTRRIQTAHPDLEIDAHRGEQPLYPLVMAAE